MNVLTFGILFWVSSTPTVFAEEPPAPVPDPVVPPVAISEIAWAGSSVSASDEWVELRNQTDAVIDLTGYSFWDAAATPAKRMLTIPSGQIGARGFFLIGNNGPEHPFSSGQSVLSVTPDVIDSDVSLSNSNLKLELRDAAGAVVDTVGNGGPGFWRDTVTPATMVRILAPLADGTHKASWTLATERSGLDASAPDVGTPTASGRPIITVPSSCRLLLTSEGEQPVRDILVTDPGGVADVASLTVVVGSQSLPTEPIVGAASTELLVRATDGTPLGPLALTITATDRSGLTAMVTLPCQRFKAVGEILITEVMGSPEENGQEFVELQNVGASEADLYGWTLDDIDTGGSAPYTIGYSLHLHSGDRIALWGSETKLKLNNSGDDVELRRPTGERADLVRFQGDRTGQSWNRGSPWYWSNPTPGRVACDPLPIEAPAQGGSSDAGLLAQPLSLHQILESIKSLAGQTVETEATVAVAQGPYHARRLIVGAGPDFAELQVKEGVSLPVTVGARLHLKAQVSTSATPRLLLGRVEDAVSIGRADRPVAAFSEANTQPLARLVSGSGQVAVAGASPTLSVSGHTVKLSRRSGLTLPTMKVGDQVHFVGVVSDLDPLQIRIVAASDVTVEPAPMLAEPSTPPPAPVEAVVAPSSVEISNRVATESMPDPITAVEATLSQLQLRTLTVGIQATAELLERRRVVITSLSAEVLSARAHRQSPDAEVYLAILLLLSGLGALSATTDLLAARLGRRVNGP